MHVNRSENLLKNTWQVVRKRLLFPESPMPEITTFPSSWPAMTIRNRKILVNENFLCKYCEKISPIDVLGAILTHGLAHHSVCPWDLRTHIELFNEATTILQSPYYGRFVVDLFLDMVVDCYCFDHGWNGIELILKAVSNCDNPFLRILLPVYAKIRGDKPWAKSSILDCGTIEYLSEINYLDRKNWFRSIRKVARALRKYLPQLLSDKTLAPPPMGYHDVYSYGTMELPESFRGLAQQTEDPTAFERIFSSVKHAYGKSEDGEPGGKMGRSLGSEIRANTLFYMCLADKYRMRIRKREIRKDGALYPFSHEQWSVSDPFYDIDIWNSMGKILPPLTVKWKKREGEGYTSQDRVPDCMIMIDSSGSMPNPSQTLSYAVLGASCAADAYLREGASVSVYNFSDAPAGNRKLIVDSRDRQEIYETICTYFGGGTALEINLLSGMIGNKQLDIFLITDMEITNLEHLIKLFESLKNIRVTAVYVGEKKGVERFQQAASKMQNVSVYGIEKPHDIMNIVLGQIKKYIHN